MWLRKWIAGDKIGHDYDLYSDDAHPVTYMFFTRKKKRPSWALGCEARRWENHKIYQTSKFTHHLNCNETNQHSRPEAGYSLVMMMTKTSFIRATNWRRLDFPTLDFPWAPTIPNQREDGHYWRWGRKNKKMMMMMIVHDLIMQRSTVFWGFSIESSIKLMMRRSLKITLKLHTIPNQPQGGSLLRTMMISLFLYSALSLLVLLPLITTNPVFLCKAPQWSPRSAYMGTFTVASFFVKM